MGYAAAFLDITAQRCVVVGGGGLALKRTQALLAACAEVTVIAENLESELAELAARGVIAVRREAALEYFAGARLVYVTEPHGPLGCAAVAHARAAGAELNVSDQPGLSTFICPALLTRGALQVAVSTGGASPALAKVVRDELEALLGDEYADLVEILAALRPALKQYAPDPAQRAKLAVELIRELRTALRPGADAEEIVGSVERRLKAGAISAKSDGSTSR